MLAGIHDVYELADGTTVELPYGFARVAFTGPDAVTKVRFSPQDTRSIRGVTALDSTGIGVEPSGPGRCARVRDRYSPVPAQYAGVSDRYAPVPAQ